MIAFVHGRVASVGADHAVIDVGGVGLSVLCGPRALADLRPGGSARVATALVVREDSLTLFGFVDEEERQAFEALQSVTGVGPRTAQAILSVLTVDQLRSAVASDDLVTLSKPPGIGRKGAARIALELPEVCVAWKVRMYCAHSRALRSPFPPCPISSFLAARADGSDRCMVTLSSHPVPGSCCFVHPNTDKKTKRHEMSK